MADLFVQILFIVARVTFYRTATLCFEWKYINETQLLIDFHLHEWFTPFRWTNMFL